MLHQVDDALPLAMSGTELSRVRTELRLLPPEAYQPNTARVEGGRHCYAIKWLQASSWLAKPNREVKFQCSQIQFGEPSLSISQQVAVRVPFEWTEPLT